MPVRPEALAISISAPSVTATSGISADGSALAIDPPTVPRLRVGGWPTHGSALANSGSLRWTISLRSTST